MLSGIVIALITFQTASSHVNINDYYHIYEQDNSYHGEMFPQKYLHKDGVQPTEIDFSYYAKTLSRIVGYFAHSPNQTNPNVALGIYFMNGILKRVLIDYNHKMNVENRDLLKDMVKKGEIIKSHFIYNYYKYGPQDLGFRFSRLFIHDDSLIYSIGEYNKNTMRKWINSNIKLNNFIEQMDNITLPRETYAELVTAMDDYYLISDSDFCLSGISMQPLPLKSNEAMKPCRYNSKCTKVVFKMPSVAYALSHRLLYILVLAQVRRCYVISEEVDRLHMDIMCANMYREAVYLARRGYFYRDLFLEHIALCTLLGYEEYNRHNWYRKSASWVDEDGCVDENWNFEINRTRIYISKTKDAKKARFLKRLRKKSMNSECKEHQMALTLCVLAFAIRHAAHYMNTTH